MNYALTRPFRFLAPNQATLIGLILAFTGTCWLITAESTFELWTGIIILSLSFLTDRLDGQLARFHDMMRHTQNMGPLTAAQERQMSLLQRINWRGSTRLGKSLDPLVDKIRFVTLMWILNDGWIWKSVSWTITLLAINLTLIRHVNLVQGYDDGSSQGGGKAKVVIEVVAIVALVFLTQPITGEVNPMLQYNNLLTTGLNLIFICALMGGVASLTGHLNKFLIGRKKT